MKASNETTAHNRFIMFTELEGDVPELEVSIKYRGEGNAGKAGTLDGVIIPELIRRVNSGLSHDQAEKIRQLLQRLYNILDDHMYRHYTVEQLKKELASVQEAIDWL